MDRNIDDKVKSMVLTWKTRPNRTHDIPLYTQDQLEEARKLGMQQERALWKLSASTQEIMDTHPVKEQDESFDRTASHMEREYVS